MFQQSFKFQQEEQNQQQIQIISILNMNLGLSIPSFKKMKVLRQKRNENEFPTHKLSIHDNKAKDQGIGKDLKANQSDTIESIKDFILQKSNFSSMKSSKIAEQKLGSRIYGFQTPRQNLHPQNSNKHAEQIKNKVNTIEIEANKIIKNKEAENNNLKSQIHYLKSKIQQLKTTLSYKEKEISLLRSQNLQSRHKKIETHEYKPHPSAVQQNQIKFLLGQIDNLNEDLRQYLKENESLKQSLNQQMLINCRNNQLISEKNQQIYHLESKISNKISEEASNSIRKDNYFLKKQVLQLGKLFAQIKENIQNCPSCAILSQENQKLSYSCQFLQKELAILKRQNSEKEHSMLNEIKRKTCENQYIKRQNRDIKLDKAVRDSYYHNSCQKRSRYESRVRDDVVKRCRTLTDIEY